MLQNGYKQSEIAHVINKDKSVVSREIRRNADARSGQYRDDFVIGVGLVSFVGVVGNKTLPAMLALVTLFSGAKIVVSSSWRLNYKFKEMQALWKHFDMRAK
jgi:hypothetical protein